MAVAVALFAGTLLGPGLSMAGHPEARRLYVDGEKLFVAKQWDGAMAKFTAAYAIDPVPIFLFNIAKCLQKAGRDTEAIDGFERYLEEAPKATNRDAVDRVLHHLRKKVSASHGRALIRSSPSGANVFLDGREVGATPVRTWMTFGRYRVRGRLKGFTDAEEWLVIERGKRASLSLKFVAPDAPGHIEITGVPPDATITFDGVQIKAQIRDGTVRWQASPGHHELTVTATGRDPYRAKIALKPGQLRQIGVALEPIRALPQPSKAFPAEGWALSVLSVVAVGVGTGLIVAANNAGVEARQYGATASNRTQARYDQLKREGQSLEVGAGITYGIAAAATLSALAVAISF